MFVLQTSSMGEIAFKVRNDKNNGNGSKCSETAMFLPSLKYSYSLKKIQRNKVVFQKCVCSQTLIC